MPRFDRLTACQIGLFSYHRSPMAGVAPENLNPSGRWIDSTLMTSAPIDARNEVAMGPLQNVDRSRTRTPSSGLSDAPSGSRPAGRAATSNSPSAGARPLGAAGVSES